MSYEDMAKINTDWGNSCKVFHGLNPVPVYDVNPMKPILFAFSRFMKGDSVQPYRVYGEIQVTHTIEILKNHMFHPNYSDNWWPCEVGRTNQQPPIMFGEEAVYYTSGDKLIINQLGSDRPQTAQFRPFTVYNPYVYSTTSVILGDTQDDVPEEEEQVDVDDTD
ncbi:uncharacterized protein LOC130630391 [Hydractinia symbiolongicarpus]|uniref:uncharacterized protein LOC130630391 n=1 Tax=Hydractinia symbiolongicarpus TaxID=13093 RepID=UPI00254C03E5|nr:uncharacterized protein LOC130630391 [Hydractinia symbiolongicarpus]